MGGILARGAKTKKVYLGSCRKINEAKAMKKAKKLKAEALG
jgi:hypothetical protein